MQSQNFQRSHHKLKYAIAIIFSVTFCMGSTAFADSDSMVDPQWKSYARVSGISGNLNSIGSDTLNNLMTLWAEGFRKEYPNVKIQIEGKGSSTAPPALIEGTAQLGPMSRKMKDKEMDKFEAKFGYKPTAFPVAVDALAVYVNKDNPIQGLSMEEVDSIFSKTRRRGHRVDIDTWGKAGLNGPWKNVTVSLYGRNSASGTYGFFKKKVLNKGDYKDQVKEQPGSASVVQGITEDRGGIGYSGIGYRTSGVRAIPLSAKSGEPFYDPTFLNASSGKYPLARFLYVYVNKAPGKPLPPLTKEFLHYVYSQQGQMVVIKDGYFPLPQKLMDKKLTEMN
ncbi:phosphate ABC transporter substrate-binding protein PstS family protein [Candidatus Nitronereus thalassa]|uniref:Phosphate-binding protein n=1 Tax=Candidatus Nitronereus thalassa TaxID=3020898 RepID=A0ABU3KA52_9BACT|nr:phosphate ABC transporter substrate-binding protein PstS family protein [Candidatus Nitronereus thalassa]MDT7043178.1 phosphate ABC transporter substrate-binding protein PstS family protein [Candidatus Nitronereus thalassa]